MFCRSCGKQIDDNAELCPHCGTPQRITELEYRTGAKSHAGAVLLQFRELPVTTQGILILELLGILLGTGGILFAALYPDASFQIGLRAILFVLSGASLLGFGIALCVTLAGCHDSEV